jgi:hypothetical protein
VRRFTITSTVESAIAVGDVWGRRDRLEGGVALVAVAGEQPGDEGLRHLAAPRRVGLAESLDRPPGRPLAASTSANRRRSVLPMSLHSSLADVLNHHTAPATIEAAGQAPLLGGGLLRRWGRVTRPRHVRTFTGGRPGHVAAVRRRFIDRVSPDRLDVIGHVAERVLAALEGAARA